MYMNWTFFSSNLSRTGTKPAILSLVQQFSKSYRRNVLHLYLHLHSTTIHQNSGDYTSALLDSKYPTVLSELYNEESGSLLRGELIPKCEDVFENVTVTAVEALNCEKVTRQQANSKQWFNFRVGRVTASRAKRVCRSSPENPSKMLIKEICYPNSKTFFAKQIQ